MASIFIKKSRPNKPYIVSYDEPGHGKRKVRQRAFATPEEAKLFKAEIELEILQWKKDNPVPHYNLLFLSDSSILFSEYVALWIPKYAKKHWEPQTCSTSIMNLDNHVLPILGNKLLGEITKQDIEAMVEVLKKKKVSGDRAKNKKEEDLKTLSSSTIRKIFNLVKVIFDTAFMDELLERNIFDRIEKPKVKYNKRAVWTPEMVSTALNNIADSLIHLFVHLAFMCTGRNGEVVGLTWDCVHLDVEKPYIYINKTLQRVDESDLKLVDSDKLVFIFPKKVADAKSVMILKDPKTEESERTIYLTAPLTEELKKRKSIVKMQKKILGLAYSDYNLVFTLDNGNPIEPTRILRRFQKWQRDNPQLNLPPVDAHSLRHTGARYTYHVTQNDIRSVQLRTGHTNAQTAHGYIDYNNDDKMAIVDALEGFYEDEEKDSEEEVRKADVEKLLEAMKNDPSLLRKAVNLIAE